MAPSKGLSAICPSRLAFRISVRTAECQGPQSCLPERMKISFVEGKEELKFVCSKGGLKLLYVGTRRGPGGAN